jgi:hypothetical protein
MHRLFLSIMTKRFFQLVACTLLLSQAGTLMAQDDQESAGTVVSEDDSTIKEIPQMKPEMSPAGGQESIATATTGLAGSIEYTVATPGVCPVVDDLVQQYCATNPDDISCQLQ